MRPGSGRLKQGHRGAGVACVVVALALGSPGLVRAQAEEWDPDLYLELTRDGQELYQRALGHDADSQARRDDLTAAGRDMKQALAMVHAALESGEYDEAERAAMRDYFTLIENLTVVWLALDACGPAQRLVDDALAHPELQREDAGLFENLAPRLTACHERAGTLAWARYRELIASAEERRAQAVDRDVPDRTLLEQAAAASVAALSAYREALFRGALGVLEPTADPVGELLARYEATVGLQLDAADCSAAAATVRAAEADRSGLLQAGASPLARASEVVGGCEQGVVVVEGRSGERGPSGAAGPGEAGRNRRVTLRDAAGGALVGTAILLGVAALTVQLTGADVRDRRDDVAADCQAGECDDDLLAQLEDEVDEREVVTWVLVGAAGVSLATGLVLLFTGEETALGDDRRDEPEESSVSVVPGFGAMGLGASIDVRF